MRSTRGDIAIESPTGAEAAAHIGELARLRMTVFRAFPYLYDGDPAYEARYLATYLRCPRAVVVVAREDGREGGRQAGRIEHGRATGRERVGTYVYISVG